MHLLLMDRIEKENIDTRTKWYR